MKVLVVDDEPISRRRLQAFLGKWGYTVLVAADGAEALDVLADENSPRLVVMDRMMPRLDGLEVCRRIRRGAPEPYVYVILLTAQDQRDDILQGFDAGADDYITKPFEIQELRARVRTGARIVELQEQLIGARERLRVEAMHDALTGVFNRAAFFDILRKEIARAERQGTPLAVIMADLDHFKDANDRHGHLAGDVVLREVARRLLTSLRQSDFLGRYGGEEFVMAAPACGVADALALAERFRASVSSKPVEIPGGSISMTMSFGVAATSDAARFGQLLRSADVALYRAKDGGRNRVEVEP